MMRKYPQFKNPELNSLVEKLTKVDKKIGIVSPLLEKLRQEQKSIEDNLRKRTYEWFIHYEYQVRCNINGRKIEPWLDYLGISNYKNYRGESVETQEEAMKNIIEAKNEISKRLKEEVTIQSLWHGEQKGIIIDYNINWIMLTKGRFEGSDKSNVIYKEEKPTREILPV